MRLNIFGVGKLTLVTLLSTQLSGLALALPLESNTSPSLDKRLLNPVSLRSASSFAVLASSTITNTGLTNITGNIGVCPGTAITGFSPPGTVTGTTYAGGPVACSAQTDAHSAYSTAIAQTPKTALPYHELGGKTLAPGTYTFDAPGVTLNGVLTLDGGLLGLGQFVIITGSTFITGANSKVVLTGGAKACNVFFAVGSSATLGISSTIVGGVLAYTAITVSHGVNAPMANLIALGTAVTLDTDTVKVPTGLCVQA